MTKVCQVLQSVLQKLQLVVMDAAASSIPKPAPIPEGVDVHVDNQHLFHLKSLFLVLPRKRATKKCICWFDFNYCAVILAVIAWLFFK
jgi:hypothetical protein